MGLIPLILQLGVPGVIGMALGYWLLSSNVRGDKNILGQTPWHWLGGAIVGAVVFGFAFWFLFGFCSVISS